MYPITVAEDITVTDIRNVINAVFSFCSKNDNLYIESILAFTFTISLFVFE